MALSDKIDMLCPLCRFPQRISGLVFVKGDAFSLSEHLITEELRCKLCRHLPDYEITDIDNKRARIIYRNFNGSDDYFKAVKSYLKLNGFVLRVV